MVNYWVVSPNVHNDNSEPEWKKAIQRNEKAYIGFDSETKTGVHFFNSIKIRDVILVAQGANRNKRCYLCGIVDSSSIWVHEQGTPGVAQNRRLINSLSQENLEQLNLDFEGCAFGDADRIPALYKLKPIENNNDLRIVNTLQNALRNKRIELLMENIKISSTRQEELKTLWIKFKEDNKNGIDSINKEVSGLLEHWNVYKSKIKAGSLSLEEYTNRKSDTESVPGYYLCNFLERTTRTVFGSSKPGNANNFEIKLNRDGESYTFRKDLKKGDKENINTKEKATEAFESNIKPLIENIVNAELPSDKVSFVENSDYSAKQVLRKLAVLDHLNDFLFIYSDEVIDALHDEFLISEEESNLGKNHELRIVLNNLLAIETTPIDSVLLSRFLWKYANTQGIADKNTPNVILYGPPGTGKTYAVKNSLDFICQGDRTRYEFIQFHPSFTYEDFIEGIKPKGVTNDGNIKFELVDGIFKSFCKKAKANPDKDYYFVVDEINRANLSSVFGETLLCLEKDYRHNVQSSDDKSLIKTQYSTLIEEMIKDNPEKQSLAYHFQDGNAYFGVPSNVFFIGMMNDVDKSIDAFDLALRRRFKWIRKDCDYDVIEQETKFRNGDEFTNIGVYLKACIKLNTYISDELGLGKSYEFGHSFFMKIADIANRKEISSSNITALFNLHLRPTLKEYMRAMFAESELDKKLEEALTKFKQPFKSN